MELPRLKTRPMSTQTCTNFRGLDRRPGASERSISRVWNWYWADEKNLSSDRCPMLSVRRKRNTAAVIDGNNLDEQIVAVSGDEKPVILDAAGKIWCGGHCLDITSPGDVYSYYLVGGDPIDPNDYRAVTPVDGSSNTPGNNDIWETLGTDQRTVTLVYDETHTPNWFWQDGNQWVSFEDLHLTPIQTPEQGNTMTINIWKQPDGLGENISIVRMGGYAIIYPRGIWVNVVDLAAGNPMTIGVEYGFAGGRALKVPEEGQITTTLTLTMCDEDGVPFTGVVVSSSEPWLQEGYWLDTSNSDRTVLKEWNATYSSWVSVVSTYVKIESLDNDPEGDGIKKGDAISLYTECDNGTDEEVKNLLNMDHYIYGGEVPYNDSGWILVAGIIPNDTLTVTITGCVANRSSPQFDFVVEAQNRLWGCRYSEADGLNEIYASKLGDFKNWSVYQGLATDSWAASRGIPAPFTGAISLSGNPLFFREESLEKVFPSTTGAHQIATYHLEGVQSGSADSMVIIDERLIYKSPFGICVYTGSLPYRISEEFGNRKYEYASAARHKRKYCVSMFGNPGGWTCAVYDLETGDWHMESEGWKALPQGTTEPWKEKACTWNGNLYYVSEGNVIGFEVSDGINDPCRGVEWYAESSPISISLPEHKWITYLRLRFRLEQEAECRVYIAYDDGPWERKGGIHGNRIVTRELGIWPRRCDHFRIRLEGTGGCELQSISWRLERSEQGH